MAERKAVSLTHSHRKPAPTLSLGGRLWRDYLGRRWRLLALALAAMAVYAASASAIPLGVEWINAAFSGGTQRFDATARDALVLGPVLVLALGAINAAAQFIQARLSQEAALAALRDLQKDMFDRLLNQDFAQIRSESSGQTISRFTSDTLVLREALTRVTTAVRDGLTLAGLCAVMIWYDWVLFAIVLLVYGLLGWPIARIGKYLRQRSSEAQAQAGDVAALVGEAVAGARAIKTYRLEDHERARAGAAFDRRFHLLNRMARLRAMNEPIIFLIGSAAMAIVVAVVAWRITAGALDATQFISFILALLLLSQPARGLASLNAALQEGLGAFERIVALLDRAPTVVDSNGAAPLRLERGAISFRGVTFSYPAGVTALERFTLEVPGGATLALVGESGAGKSTVLSLLPRLYDVGDGAILIDGQDIRATTLSSLRSAIAVVSQDAHLFNDTIYANIAVGRPGAGRADIERAATAASLDDVLARLPKGFDAPVGEGGADLSGGQRQRVALARAFLKDAPILLLDEATSALDAESEAKVQEAIARLAKGRTSIVIAHRLATVISASLIAVMDKGGVAEIGTHADLIAKGGLYARLAARQFGAPVKA